MHEILGSSIGDPLKAKIYLGWYYWKDGTLIGRLEAALFVEGWEDHIN